jgi:hypothetical protein
MNHSEFHAAVADVAAGRCFATRVEATTYTTGSIAVVWSAYIADVGWSETYNSPREVLAFLNDKSLAATTLEDIGTSPTASAEPIAPESSFVEEHPGL